MKNIENLGRRDIEIWQGRSCRGTVSARVVRADVQILAADDGASPRLTAKRLDLARIQGVYFALAGDRVVFGVDDKVPACRQREEV